MDVLYPLKVRVMVMVPESAEPSFVRYRLIKAAVFGYARDGTGPVQLPDTPGGKPEKMTLEGELSIQKLTFPLLTMHTVYAVLSPALGPREPKLMLVSSVEHDGELRTERPGVADSMVTVAFSDFEAAIAA